MLRNGEHYDESRITSYFMNARQRTVRNIEELSMNAWPSLWTFVYDGWILRFNEGYTRRANCINPLYPSVTNIARKIEYCEQLYIASGLRPIYKMTDAAYPSDLDGLLYDHGYHREADTSVQLTDLAAVRPERDPHAAVTEGIDDDWMIRFMMMNQVPDRYASIVRVMFRNIPVPVCFVSIKHGKKSVACGVGVLQNDMFGIFDLIVDRRYRKRGFGTRLVHALLCWARDRQARTAYLQVMLDNHPARDLYKKIGFTEVYQYWYRVREGTHQE